MFNKFVSNNILRGSGTLKRPSGDCYVQNCKHTENSVSELTISDDNSHNISRYKHVGTNNETYHIL